MNGTPHRKTLPAQFTLELLDAIIYNANINKCFLKLSTIGIKMPDYTNAASQILEEMDKSLHYKKITHLAKEWGLFGNHDPDEKRMLATLTKNAQFEKVSDGMFTLRRVNIQNPVFTFIFTINLDGRINMRSILNEMKENGDLERLLLENCEVTPQENYFKTKEKFFSELISKGCGNKCFNKCKMNRVCQSGQLCRNQEACRPGSPIQENELGEYTAKLQEDNVIHLSEEIQFSESIKTKEELIELLSTEEFKKYKDEIVKIFTDNKEESIASYLIDANFTSEQFNKLREMNIINTLYRFNDFIFNENDLKSILEMDRDKYTKKQINEISKIWENHRKQCQIKFIKMSKENLAYFVDSDFINEAVLGCWALNQHHLVDKTKDIKLGDKNHIKNTLHNFNSLNEVYFLPHKRERKEITDELSGDNKEFPKDGIKPQIIGDKFFKIGKESKDFSDIAEFIHLSNQEVIIKLFSNGSMSILVEIGLNEQTKEKILEINPKNLVKLIQLPNLVVPQYIESTQGVREDEQRNRMVEKSEFGDCVSKLLEKKIIATDETDFNKVFFTAKIKEVADINTESTGVKEGDRLDEIKAIWAGLPKKSSTGFLNFVAYEIANNVFNTFFKCLENNRDKVRTISKIDFLSHKDAITSADLEDFDIDELLNSGILKRLKYNNKLYYFSPRVHKKKTKNIWTELKKILPSLNESDIRELAKKINSSYGGINLLIDNKIIKESIDNSSRIKFNNSIISRKFLIKQIGGLGIKNENHIIGLWQNYFINDKLSLADYLEIERVEKVNEDYEPINNNLIGNVFLRKQLLANGIIREDKRNKNYFFFNKQKVMNWAKLKWALGEIFDKQKKEILINIWEVSQKKGNLATKHFKKKILKDKHLIEELKNRKIIIQDVKNESLFNFNVNRIKKREKLIEVLDEIFDEQKKDNILDIWRLFRAKPVFYQNIEKITYYLLVTFSRCLNRLRKYHWYNKTTVLRYNKYFLPIRELIGDAENSKEHIRIRRKFKSNRYSILKRYKDHKYTKHFSKGKTESNLIFNWPSIGVMFDMPKELELADEAQSDNYDYHQLSKLMAGIATQTEEFISNFKNPFDYLEKNSITRGSYDAIIIEKRGFVACGIRHSGSDRGSDRDHFLRNPYATLVFSIESVLATLKSVVAFNKELEEFISPKINKMLTKKNIDYSEVEELRRLVSKARSLSPCEDYSSNLLIHLRSKIASEGAQKMLNYTLHDLVASVQHRLDNFGHFLKTSHEVLTIKKQKKISVSMRSLLMLALFAGSVNAIANHEKFIKSFVLHKGEYFTFLVCVVISTLIYFLTRKNS